MSQLLLLRHADALPPGATGAAGASGTNGSDRERALSPRGQRAADAVATHLERTGLVPDLALCSPALRARETLDPLRRRQPSLAVRYEDELYLASAGGLAERVARVEADCANLLLVGHNPGIADLGVWLDPDARDRLRMPPAALALFRLRVETWADLAAGAAELVSLVFGEKLAAGDGPTSGQAKS